jgi:hypothetical protein
MNAAELYAERENTEVLKPRTWNFDQLITNPQRSSSFDETPTWMYSLSPKAIEEILLAIAGSTRDEGAITMALHTCNHTLLRNNFAVARQEAIQQLLQRKEFQLHLRSLGGNFPDAGGQWFRTPLALRRMEDLGIARAIMHSLTEEEDLPKGNVLNFTQWEKGVTAPLALQTAVKKMDITKVLENPIPDNSCTVMHHPSLGQKGDNDLLVLEKIIRATKINGVVVSFFNDHDTNGATRHTLRAHARVPESGRKLDEYMDIVRHSGCQARIIRGSIQMQAASQEGKTALAEFTRFMVPEKYRQSPEDVEGWLRQTLPISGFFDYGMSALVIKRPEHFSYLRRESSRIETSVRVIPTTVKPQWTDLSGDKLAKSDPVTVLTTLMQIQQIGAQGSDNRELHAALAACGLSAAMYKDLLELRDVLETNLDAQISVGELIARSEITKKARASVKQTVTSPSPVLSASTPSSPMPTVFTPERSDEVSVSELARRQLNRRANQMGSFGGKSSPDKRREALKLIGDAVDLGFGETSMLSMLTLTQSVVDQWRRDHATNFQPLDAWQESQIASLPKFIRDHSSYHELKKKAGVALYRLARQRNGERSALQLLIQVSISSHTLATWNEELQGIPTTTILAEIGFVRTVTENPADAVASITDNTGAAVTTVFNGSAPIDTSIENASDTEDRTSAADNGQQVHAGATSTAEQNGDAQATERSDSNGEIDHNEVIDGFLKGLLPIAERGPLTSAQHTIFSNAYHQLLDRGYDLEKFLDATGLSPYRFRNFRDDASLPYQNLSATEAAVKERCEEILRAYKTEPRRRGISEEVQKAVVVCLRYNRRISTIGSIPPVLELSGLSQPTVCIADRKFRGISIRNLVPNLFPVITEATDELPDITPPTTTNVDTSDSFVHQYDEAEQNGETTAIQGLDAHATSQLNTGDGATPHDQAIAGLLQDLPIIGSYETVTEDQHRKIATAYQQLINRGFDPDYILEKTGLNVHQMRDFRFASDLPYCSLSAQEMQVKEQCATILQRFKEQVTSGKKKIPENVMRAAIVHLRYSRRVTTRGMLSEVVSLSGISQPTISGADREFLGVSPEHLLPDLFPVDNEAVDRNGDTTVMEALNVHDDLLTAPLSITLPDALVESAEDPVARLEATCAQLRSDIEHITGQSAQKDTTIRELQQTINQLQQQAHSLMTFLPSDFPESSGVIMTNNTKPGVGTILITPMY